MAGRIRPLPDTDVGRIVRAGLCRPGARISFEGVSWTGRELARRADVVATSLRRIGVGPEIPVAVLMEPGVELVSSLLGVLRSGGFFVPLDPRHPRRRLSWMLNRVRPAVAITHRRMLGDVDAGLVGPRTQVVAIEDLEADDTGAKLEAPAISSETAAYALFTSGSTGRPKAVVVPHRGLANYLFWRSRETPLDPGERVLALAPAGLDVSLREMLWPLSCAAHLVIAPAGVRADPAAILELLATERINIVHLLPSLLDRLLEEPAVGRLRRDLRLIHASSEPLTRPTQQCLRDLLDADLHHSYGPTEASISVTHCLVPQAGSHSWSPLGAAADNTELYLLDERLESVAPGQPGEIYIGGMALARGYLGAPGLTAERFVPHPGRRGCLLYRTGDRARWHPDSGLLWSGRVDDQLKVRGHRVEPAEIEAVLGTHGSVANAAVTTAGVGLSTTLIALLIRRSGLTGIDLGDVRAFVAARLPDHLRPQRIVEVEALPRTAAGKLDRGAVRVAALAELARVDGADGETDARPTPSEPVARIWREVLGVTAVAPDDDFFRLGGHSLSAMLVIARLRARVGVEISVRELFRHRTLQAFQAAVDRQLGRDTQA